MQIADMGGRLAPSRALTHYQSYLAKRCPALVTPRLRCCHALPAYRSRNIDLCDGSAGRYAATNLPATKR